MVKAPGFGRSARYGDIKLSLRPNDADHDGWLLLGSAARNVSRTAYAELFKVLGTAYGVGDGSTTFGLPGVGDAFPLLAGAKHALGQAGGVEDVTLTVDQIPAHAHGYSRATVAPTASQKALLTGVGIGDVTKPPTTSVGTSTTDAAGNGKSHTNMPPFFVMTAFIYAGVAR